MRTLSHSHAADALHGIDLAPLLDFAINLLIFFIVTAVFVKQAGLEVGRPSGAQPASKTSSKSIAIDENGAISVDGKTIDVRAVRAHIEQFRAASPEGGVVIAADAGAPMGAIVGVVDEIRLGGIADITFTTTGLADPE